MQSRMAHLFALPGLAHSNHGSPTTAHSTSSLSQVHEPTQTLRHQPLLYSFPVHSALSRDIAFCRRQLTLVLEPVWYRILAISVPTLNIADPEFL